jgi:hypothetical protein
MTVSKSGGAGSSDIIVLGTGTYTTTANNSTWEDAGQITVPSALGSGAIFLVMFGITSTGAGTGQRIGYDAAAGNSVYSANTASAQMMIATDWMVSPSTATNMSKRESLSNAGSFTLSEQADVTCLDFSAAEVIYLKAYCVATNVLKVRWMCYMVKANSK